MKARKTLGICSYVFFIFSVFACEDANLEKSNNSPQNSEQVTEAIINSNNDATNEKAALQILIDSARIAIDSSHYRKAIKIADEILSQNKLGGQISDTIYATAYNVMSDGYLRIKMIDSALIAVDEAYKIVTNLLPNDSNIVLAECFRNYGYVFKLKGEYDQSINYFEKAEQLYQILLPPDHLKIAWGYNDLATVWGRKGYNKRALIYFQRALSILLKKLDPSNNKIANIYHNMANAYHDQYDYDLALDYYQRAADIRISNNNKYHLYTGFHLLGMGRVYWKTSAYSETLKYMDKAEEVFKAVSRPGDFFYDNPGIQMYRSFVARKENDFGKAEKYQKKALEVSLNLYGDNNKDVANIYLNLGIVYKEAGAYDLSFEALEKAYKMYLDAFGPDAPQLTQYYNTIGMTHRLAGNLSKAIEAHNKAVKVTGFDWDKPQDFSKIMDFGTLRETFFSIVDYYKAQQSINPNGGYLDSLQAHYQIMMKMEDYLQTEYTVSSSRQFYASQAFSIYEGAIGNIVQRKQTAEFPNAFILAEKTKSRQLNEKIQSASSKATFGLPESISRQEYDLEKKIEEQKRNIFEESKKKPVRDSLITSYRDSLFTLKQSRDQLKLELKSKYPNYYSKRYSHQVINIKGVQDSLLKNDRQALVEYFVGDSSLYVFTILRDTFYINKIKKDFPLGQWVKDFRCGIFGEYRDTTECPNITSKEAIRQYTSAAYQLYQKIFLPIETYLPSQAELTVIPDGILGYIPFEALLSERPNSNDQFLQFDYLLNKYNISYAYSATLQKEMLYKEHDKIPEKPLIAFAPLFEGDEEENRSFLATRFIDVKNSRNWLSPLKYNIPEAEEVARAIGGVAVTGTSATEAAFRAQIDEYKIIHLATHGKANDKIGDYSFLAFYQTPDDDIENEWLYNSELYNLNLNADMVVLSACETGIGELKRGEGIISLARGFSYAGAKSIITSLWNVNDLSSKLLMEKFYQNLNLGMPKDEALRQAKLAYMKDPNLADSQRAPFYWAAFIPVGDMTQIKFQNNNHWYWMMALGLSILFIIPIWRTYGRNSTKSE